MPKAALPALYSNDSIPGFQHFQFQGTSKTETMYWHLSQVPVSLSGIGLASLTEYDCRHHAAIDRRECLLAQGTRMDSKHDEGASDEPSAHCE